MFGWLNPLHRLRNKLKRKFRHDPAIDVRLLPENQLLVTKDLIPNREAQQGGKAVSHVPAETGFRVFLSVRSPDAHAAASSQGQRIGPKSEPALWDPSIMTLRVGQNERNAEWLFLNHRGEVVAVRALSGSPEVLPQVNDILQEIEAFYT